MNTLLDAPPAWTAAVIDGLPRRAASAFDAGPSKSTDANALDRLIDPDRVTLGVLAPLDNDWQSGRLAGAQARLQSHTARLVAADAAGVKALWLRDVPSCDRADGDAGHLYDPWSYLGYLSAVTRHCVLGTAGIVLPLDHEIHVAKRAASIDQLSSGRLALGVCTGDRDEEHALFGHAGEQRARRLRDSVGRMRSIWQHGGIGQAAVLPRPMQPSVPLVIVGQACQSVDWIAQHADAWFTASRDMAGTAELWRAALDRTATRPKPLFMPLRLILEPNPEASMQVFSLGVRSGIQPLRRHLDSLKRMGIAHVALNLRLSEQPVEAVIDALAEAGLL